MEPDDVRYRNRREALRQANLYRHIIGLDATQVVADAEEYYKFLADADKAG